MTYPSLHKNMAQVCHYFLYLRNVPVDRLQCLLYITEREFLRTYGYSIIHDTFVMNNGLPICSTIQESLVKPLQEPWSSYFEFNVANILCGVHYRIEDGHFDENKQFIRYFQDSDELFYGHLSKVVEAHIEHITKKFEAWNIIELQQYIKELPEIRAFSKFFNDVHENGTPIPFETILEAVGHDKATAKECADDIFMYQELSEQLYSQGK